MSKNLQNCLKELYLIANIKKLRVRQEVLKDISDNECIYNALKEIAVNTVNRKIKLNPKQRRKLQKSAFIINEFSKSQKSRKKKRKLVVQTGGALPILIPAVIALLTNLIQNGML